MVTRHVYDKKQSSPCFSIYLLNQSIPYIFLSSSENKVDDWVNQISIYCSKTIGLSSLLTASTLVSSDGFAYYAYSRNHKPIYLSQIGYFNERINYFIKNYLIYFLNFKMVILK